MLNPGHATVKNGTIYYLYDAPSNNLVLKQELTVLETFITKWNANSPDVHKPGLLPTGTKALPPAVALLVTAGNHKSTHEGSANQNKHLTAYVCDHAGWALKSPEAGALVHIFAVNEDLAQGYRDYYIYDGKRDTLGSSGMQNALVNAAANDLGTLGKGPLAWPVVGVTPPGFEQVGFDASQRPIGFVERPYPDVAPRNQDGHTITVPPPTQAPNPSLDLARWIWTGEATRPGIEVPAGNRVFRKTIKAAPNQLFWQAHILITVDNGYTLYVNGVLVGSSHWWPSAQRYIVNFQPSSTVVIAVFATNEGPGNNPAGVLIAGELASWNQNGQNHVPFTSDTTWRYNTQITSDFFLQTLDDSAWPTAVDEGGNGVAPWGKIIAPAASTSSPPVISPELKSLLAKIDAHQ